ncbi:MAG: hypothetical protein Q9204_006843 [Flavoplaca sp. TL-2023a]
MPGEPLAAYITPDTNVSIDSGPLPDRTGDIVILKAEYESQLDSAVLDATILRYPNFDIFKRYITNTAGKDIGYRSMERPVPDPDLRFRDLAQDPFLETFPTGLHSALDPASLIPSRTESCGTKPSNCFLIIPSADVFYFGPTPTNTACLSAVITPAPSPAPPPLDPSSVYVVYSPPQIFDECRRWLGGAAGPPITLSYQSSALSSIQYCSDGPPMTKSIDFADLPCPPSDVATAYDPRVPYLPVLKSEIGIKFNLHISQDDQKMIGDETCKVAAVRDPPVHAIRLDALSQLASGGSPFP